ncbi:cytochrome P450 [Amycolatopsis pithecellobii]|nr:cytochrome P450 [Amycolatopsis pithecellobii]
MTTTPPLGGPDTIPIAPGKIPALGHALAFRKDPINFLTSLSAIGELVKVYLGPVQTYAVTSPRVVYQLLVTEAAHFENGRIFDKMRGFFGNGLITSNGAFHRRQRRLIQPAFSQKNITTYTEVMRREIGELVASWQEGTVVDIQAATDDLSLRIGVATLFKTELGTSAKETVKECLPVVLRGLLVRTLLPDVVFKLPIPGIQRLNDAERRLRAAIGEIIRTYRADGADHEDILSALLAARDDETGEGMSDAEVLDEVVSLVLAATETNSSVLASFFYRLAEHPEIADRVSAEIDGVLGGRQVQYEDLTKFKHTLNALSEVLRLDMPVDMFMRRATEEVVIGETRLPAGSEFIFSIPALHRNPDVYPDPLQFDPDRWIRRPARDLPRGSYIPFGTGGRICVGNAFAWAELTVVATTVLAKWRLTVAPGAKPKRVHQASTHFTSLPMALEAR